MISKIVINKTLRKVNRRLAWLLAVLLILIFVSGYGLVGKLNIPVMTAGRIHRQFMPLTIVLFVFHAVYSALILIYQRKKLT